MTFLSECKALRILTTTTARPSDLAKPCFFAGNAWTKSLMWGFVVCIVLAAQSTANAQMFAGSPQAKNRFDIGYRAFDRQNDKDTAPAVSDGPLGATLLQIDQVTDLSVGNGIDFAWVFDGNNGFDYEIRASYFTWDGENSVTGTNLATTFAPGFSFNDISTLYESDYFSIELNQRRDISSGLTVLAGIRYMKLDEELTFNGAGQIPFPPFGTFPFNASSQITTKNPMIGLQAGFEGNFGIVQGVNLVMFGKGGVYSNSAESSTTNDSNFTAPTGFRGQNAVTSFAGEYSIRLNYDIILNQMSFFLGYDGLYIDQIALAPTQTSLITGIEDDDAAFMHGISFGLSLKR